MKNNAHNLVEHLNDMLDSLDESVTHEQVYEQLYIAWNMARDLFPPEN